MHASAIPHAIPLHAQLVLTHRSDFMVHHRKELGFPKGIEGPITIIIITSSIIMFISIYIYFLCMLALMPGVMLTAMSEHTRLIFHTRRPFAR